MIRLVNAANNATIVSIENTVTNVQTIFSSPLHLCFHTFTGLLISNAIHDAHSLRNHRIQYADILPNCTLYSFCLFRYAMVLMISSSIFFSKILNPNYCNNTLMDIITPVLTNNASIRCRNLRLLESSCLAM